MLGEVFADEHVEQVGVSAQVSSCQRDELAITRCGRVAARPPDQGEVEGEQRGRHQERRRSGAVGAAEDLARRIGMIPDQAVEEGIAFVGHIRTLNRVADEPLTVESEGGSEMRRSLQ